MKVPNFLVENIKEDISDRDIYDSLNLISEYKYDLSQDITYNFIYK